MGIAIRKLTEKKLTSWLDDYIFICSLIYHFFYSFTHSFIFQLIVVGKNPQGKKIKSICQLLSGHLGIKLDNLILRTAL